MKATRDPPHTKRYTQTNSKELEKDNSGTWKREKKLGQQDLDKISFKTRVIIRDKKDITH